jgi:hypothetical protein
MGFHGPLVFLVIHGYPLVFMCTHVKSLLPRCNHGHRWVPRDCQGYPWLPIGIYEHPTTLPPSRPLRLLRGPLTSYGAVYDLLVVKFGRPMPWPWGPRSLLAGHRQFFGQALGWLHSHLASLPATREDVAVPCKDGMQTRCVFGGLECRR